MSFDTLKALKRSILATDLQAQITIHNWKLKTIPLRRHSRFRAQNVAPTKNETGITSNLRLRNPIWITINKLMWGRNLFISRSLWHTDDEPRDERWIPMKFYKKRAFSTYHYGQNVILFLTYHHYRTASQCPFERVSFDSTNLSLHVKTDDAEWVSRVRIISLQLKACFISRDRTEWPRHGWATVKHFHEYNDTRHYFEGLWFRNGRLPFVGAEW